MIDAHRVIMLCSRDRLNITLEEFMILFLFKTKSNSDMYRFSFEVPSAANPNKGPVGANVFDSLVNKGYLKVSNDHSDIINERYELNDTVFENELMDSLEATKEVFTLYPPFMFDGKGMRYTTRNIGIDEAHRIIQKTIGFSSRSITPEYKKSKGSARIGKLMMEENLYFVDKKLYEKMIDNTKKFIELTKARKVNPIGIVKFLEGMLWYTDDIEKAVEVDYSEDL